MIATVLAGVAEFERELIQERIRSSIAAATARGKRLGRQRPAAKVELAGAQSAGTCRKGRKGRFSALPE